METPIVPKRPDWTVFFLGIADAVSVRADCSRRRVGALIVDTDRRIASTGYNGSAPGGRSCLKGECPRGNSDVAPLSSYDTGAGSCIALHAEQNAIMYASWEQRQGATCYVTCMPCDGCMRMLAGSGVHDVVWRDELSGGYGYRQVR